MSARRVHVVVSGRVQGVFFRQGVWEEARRLGLTGWVRNTDDGRVEAELQGPSEAVDEALAFVALGPERAHVDEVADTDVPSAADETGFEVR